MSEIESDLSGKSKVSFKVGAEILDLLFLYSELIFLHV